MKTKKFAAIGVGAACLLGLTAQGCDETSNTAVKDDQKVAAQSLDRLNTAQPVPSFAWSQVRQNLIELTKAQAETTQTTTFFFNQGVASPISSCPSIGFPIPSTAQLTNPDQAIGDIGRNGSGAVVAQVEQTGIYTGDSTGTYVICVDAAGEAYAFYWEGFVAAVAGPAEWDDEAQEVRLIGAPSGNFSSGKG